MVKFIDLEKQTQVATLVKHFQQKRTLTGIEALHLYKIRDLPKRISELRENGFEIAGAFERDTTGHRFMRYSVGDNFDAKYRRALNEQQRRLVRRERRVYYGEDEQQRRHDALRKLQQLGQQADNME